MPLAPVTEDDSPIVEKMIHKLKSLRKRETANGKRYSTDNLDKAIEELHEYGAMKGWWKMQNDPLTFR